MRNLNGRNGSSSSVVVRPRLLPTALDILMKMYSNVQDHKTITKPSVEPPLNGIVDIVLASYYYIYIARPCCFGAVQMYHCSYMCGGTHW